MADDTVHETVHDTVHDADHDTVHDENFHDTASPALAVTDPFSFVCNAAAVTHPARFHYKSASGRYITVLTDPITSTVVAIDALCYHMGGPLTVGDIEEVDGEACLKCPWHFIPIRLSDGARMYQSVSFAGPMNKMVKDPEWKAQARLQKVFDVEIRAGDVYVNVEGSEDEVWKSDNYSHNDQAAQNLLAPEEIRRRRGAPSSVVKSSVMRPI